MEKNNRKEARTYLKKALDLTKGDNHEIIRCYGLCEYWYGNREKGMGYLKDAFEMNTRDAEVIYNIIQLEMLEHNYTKAKEMITYFYEVHDTLTVVDKTLDWYDKKIALFEKFLKTQHLFTVNK
jgi:Tfp pilus assembly protein PilF